MPAAAEAKSLPSRTPWSEVKQGPTAQRPRPTPADWQQQQFYRLRFPRVFTATAPEHPRCDPETRQARRPGINPAALGGEPPAREPPPAPSGSRGHSPATRSARKLRRPRRRPLRPPHASSSGQRRAPGGGAPLPLDPRGKEGDGGGTRLGAAWEGPWCRRAG